MTIEAAANAVRPSSLAAGLIRAQGAIERVAKSGQNQFHRYAYATAEDMVDEARGALNAGGLALFARRYSSELRGDLLWLCVKYELVHEGGEKTELESETPVIPEKGRPEDKALAAAKTYDLAYLLRALLLIPRGEEDGGVDRRDDRNKQARRPESRPELKPEPEKASEPVPANGVEPAPDPAQADFEAELHSIGEEIAAAIGKDQARFHWARELRQLPRMGKDLTERRRAYLAKAYALRDRLLADAVKNTDTRAKPVGAVPSELLDWVKAAKEPDAIQVIEGCWPDRVHVFPIPEPDPYSDMQMHEAPTRAAECVTRLAGLRFGGRHLFKTPRAIVSPKGVRTGFEFELNPDVVAELTGRTAA